MSTYMQQEVGVYCYVYRGEGQQARLYSYSTIGWACSVSIIATLLYRPGWACSVSMIDRVGV